MVVPNDDLADAVFKSQNNARTNPSGFVTILEAYRAKFKRASKDPKNTTLSNEVLVDGVTYMTQEGVKAVDEAIAFLKAAAKSPSKLAAFTRNSGMNMASEEHVAD